ncbi:MAG: hypothetical protein NDI69_03290 [Bacteriovoracaceae bacterium]|nr:hypothetical protein [Bacteriovoracaceae bacterium]
MKSPNTERKTSDDLKHEVHHELRKVRRDIDEMQSRLSPGQIIDDAIFYPHGRSVVSTFDHLKNNPVGTALLSLGTLLLMEDENHVTYERNARIKANSLKEGIKNQMPHKELQPGQVPNAMDRAKAKVTGLKHDLQTKKEELKQTIERKKSDVKERFSETQEHLSLGADFEGAALQGPSRKEKVRESYEKTREKLSTGFQSGKEKIQNLDPLAYMALGAGLGALTGASLPISDAERNLVDTRFTGKLSDFSRELQDAVNQSSNILKDLFIDDAKGFSADIFNRSVR